MHVAGSALEVSWARGVDAQERRLGRNEKCGSCQLQVMTVHDTFPGRVCGVVKRGTGCGAFAWIITLTAQR